MRRTLPFALLAVTVFLSVCEKARAQAGGEQSEPLIVPRGHVPSQTLRNLHLTGGITDVIQQAFRLYGIDVVFVPPLQGYAKPLQVDMKDADLAMTGWVLSAMTRCFFVPVNAHLILAMEDDAEHRKKYEETAAKIINIPNMQAGNAQQQSEVTGLLSNVFGATRITLHGSTVTVRATRKDIIQIEDTLVHLFQPEPQVLLEVKAYLVTRSHNRNVGVQTPQQITVFNIDTEAESLISSNESVVDGLIASGVVSATDTLGIVVALIASGYGSGSVLSSPFVDFGGGATATGVQFGSVDANLNLTTSSSQQLQDAMLHLVSDQAGTLKIGQRYPVMTSSTVSLGALTSTATPSIQYEDLGLTLEAKPHIEDNGEVLLHLHETFRSLAGTSLNGIPVINNQDFVSDLSVPSGQTTVVVSDLSKTESETAQGLVNLFPTDSAKDQQMSNLVITITPTLTRTAHHHK